jgi:hypothetical protein
MGQVFIDDSGSSGEEPVMYVAGWVGQASEWDAFSADWKETLTARNPKPIAYFKHYEARSLTKCFRGFTAPEANAKMLNLAAVITRYNVYGAVYAVARNYLRRMIQKHAVTIKGRAHQNLEDPFFICANSLMGYVMGSESVGHPGQKVDLIFDGKPGSAQANRLTTMLEVCRELAPEPIPHLLGSATPMDDKEALPLQAADLLVGQVRMAVQTRAEDPEPLKLIRQHKFVWVKIVDEEIILSTISFHNFGISTRRLLTIERERRRSA